MLLLIPISRYRIAYQVAAGRPYSVFERLVLKAVYEGVADVSTLREVFQVHPRLILEALVTLTQAGWLAVGGPDMQGFRLTSSGQDAVQSGRDPRSRLVEPRNTWIVMERLTGALINEGAVRYLTAAQVMKLSSKAIKIAERIHDRRLSEGQIDALLPRAKNEWLYRIESIDLKTRHAHWLPVTLDTNQWQFDDNLPFHWRSRVAPALEEEVRNSPKFEDAEIRAVVGPSLPHRPRPYRNDEDIDKQPSSLDSYRIALKNDDFLFSDEEHFSCLREALLTSHSRVFIASAFLRANCLEALKTEFLSALSRGVTIDVLWGYNSGRQGETDGVEVLKKISFEARTSKFRGKINFNRTASGSHSKIIIWDRGESVEACIGSFNWLSVVPSPIEIVTPDEQKFTNISVRLRSPLLIAKLIRSIASLWSGGRTHSLDATPDRWRRLASQIEQNMLENNLPNSEENNNATARLILDFDHDAFLRSALAQTKRRLTVISHKLGVAARTRLVAATNKERSPEFKFTVLYSQRDVQEATYADIGALIASAGGTMHRRPGLHAKAVLADDQICIGSYNFLSTDIYGTASRTKELSILIEGAEVVSWIESRLG